MWPTVNPVVAFQTYLYMTMTQLTAFSVSSYSTEGVEILEEKIQLYSGVYVKQRDYICSVILIVVVYIK